MPERVVPLDLGVTWEPNAPEAVLVAADNGRARLALMPRFDDPDQRTVFIVWSGCHAVRMEGPNDEARSGHRLYNLGLDGVLWAGEVLDSALIVELEAQNRVHPRHDPQVWAGLHHYVIPLKETTIEVVAQRCETVRVEAGPVVRANG